MLLLYSRHCCCPAEIRGPSLSCNLRTLLITPSHVGKRYNVSGRQPVVLPQQRVHARALARARQSKAVPLRSPRVPPLSPQTYVLCAPVSVPPRGAASQGLLRPLTGPPFGAPFAPVSVSGRQVSILAPRVRSVRRLCPTNTRAACCRCSEVVHTGDSRPTRTQRPKTTYKCGSPSFILEVQERASQTGEGRGERLAKLVCVVSAMPPLGRNPLSIYHLITSSLLLLGAPQRFLVQ